MLPPRGNFSWKKDEGEGQHVCHTQHLAQRSDPWTILTIVDTSEDFTAALPGVPPYPAQWSIKGIAWCDILKDSSKLEIGSTDWPSSSCLIHESILKLMVLFSNPSTFHKYHFCYLVACQFINHLTHSATVIKISTPNTLPSVMHLSADGLVALG